MAEAVFGASKLLHAVLEKYNGASLGIPSLCTQADWDDSHQQLLDRLADDIQQLRSHEEKLLQATSKLNEFKNSRTVQINTLPDDILTTIFLLVHEHWPCAVAHYSPLASNIAFPKSPKTLSHVCSRWRRVTIHLQNLWSHIDLALGDPRRRGLLDRAETYAARAGSLPLHIHVIYSDYAPEWAQFSPFVIKVFRSVTTRITSLDVFLSHTRRETNPTRDLQARVLSPCLQIIPPEMLTKLTIVNFFDSHFISSYDAPRPTLVGVYRYPTVT